MGISKTRTGGYRQVAGFLGNQKFFAFAFKPNISVMP